MDLDAALSLEFDMVSEMRKFAYSNICGASRAGRRAARRPSETRRVWRERPPTTLPWAARARRERRLGRRSTQLRIMDSLDAADDGF